MYKVFYIVQNYDGTVLGHSKESFSENIVQLLRHRGDSYSTAVKRQVRNAYRGPRMAGSTVQCRIESPEQDVWFWDFVPVG